MTEAEWNNCADPQPMLEFLRSKASNRKQRLLVVGICRHLWALLSDQGRRCLEVAERFADGQATAQELEEARWKADDNSVTEDGSHQQAELDRCLPRSAEDDALFLREVDYRRERLQAAMLAHDATFPDELAEACSSSVRSWKNAVGFVRCIFGPTPFRPVIIDRSWLTTTVTQLGEAIYAERTFDRMPILADALEDAGCTNQDILAHCRSAGDHIRGCWVVDLLLGKS